MERRTMRMTHARMMTGSVYDLFSMNVQLTA
jgi:hypothetical protein